MKPMPPAIVAVAFAAFIFFTWDHSTSPILLAVYSLTLGIYIGLDMAARLLQWAIEHPDNPHVRKIWSDYSIRIIRVLHTPRNADFPRRSNGP